MLSGWLSQSAKGSSVNTGDYCDDYESSKKLNFPSSQSFNALGFRDIIKNR